jgi:hypothetical protein
MTRKAIESRQFGRVTRVDKLNKVFQQNLVFPWITLGLIALLMLLAPFAMRYVPFEGVHEFGAYRAPYEQDPLLSQRVALVWIGIGSTGIAVLECAVLFFRQPNRVTLCTGIAAWFACAVLGFRSMPYWAAGVYAVYSQRVPFTDLDPKRLVPIDSLGDPWRLLVLFLYPAACVAIPAGVVGSVLLYRRRSGFWSVIPSLCAAIGLFFMLAFSPGYVDWLMD